MTSNHLRQSAAQQTTSTRTAGLGAYRGWVRFSGLPASKLGFGLPAVALSGALAPYAIILRDNVPLERHHDARRFNYETHIEIDG